ncbi:hypothetical protein GCM10018962_77700 [Dactylosporangium matsuzakiense]|uniref:peptidoglycan-binding domain-containing protein n=1 Tax=Dactylosporangium matsuzakiense TaxID=53360 RepID=UPI0031EBDFB7
MGAVTDASQAFYDRIVSGTPHCRGGGIYANKSGYHNTRAANVARWPGNYSYRDQLDQRGPDDKAAAYDFVFADAQAGDFTTIDVYSSRLYAAGKAGDVRLAGWAEFYGQTDTDSHVEGLNFRRRSDETSDDSHLWHCHASESRELVAETINKAAFESVWHGETLEAWAARVGFPAYGGVNLRRGTRSASVWLWQRQAGIAADGDFGPQTEAKVREVQAAAGATVDGVIGPVTWELIRGGTPTPPPTGPAPTPPPAPKPPAPRPPARIAEDGELGPETIRRWQQVMGTPVDGVISRPKSSLILAVQRHLNARGARLQVDGDPGPNTIRALQRYLGTPVDGVISRPKSQMVLALQRRLNGGTF